MTKIENEIIIGNAIPKDFFIATGTGQSDVAIHSGSYQFALDNAGISRCNMITYTSSMLPRISNKIEKPNDFEPGTVLQGMLSVCNSRRGQRATAGICYGWLIDKETNKKFSGLICENWGYYSERDLKAMLEESLSDIHKSNLSDRYTLTDIVTSTESFVPTKANGTALVALCFVNYVRPIKTNYTK